MIRDTRPPIERFWAHLPDRGDGCWEWTGGTLATGGYGKLSVNGAERRAHRFSYELLVGPIPDGLCVLHRCDNRPCCNPSHLFLGTRRDNNYDMATKKRGRSVHTDQTHCRRGHEFSAANTYVCPKGSRTCRICRDINDKRRRTKARAQKVGI